LKKYSLFFRNSDIFRGFSFNLFFKNSEIFGGFSITLLKQKHGKRANSGPVPYNGDKNVLFLESKMFYI
jgi:hypothetical protein